MPKIGYKTIFFMPSLQKQYGMHYIDQAWGQNANHSTRIDSSRLILNSAVTM